MPAATATRSDMKLKPLSDKVVIEISMDETEMTPGGIVLPDTAREKPQQGMVIAVGPGKLNETTGKRDEMPVKVGDKVLFQKYGGTDLKMSGKEYKILSERDLLGILE